MSTKNDVLYVLECERGRYLSGQELASRLDISRTAVWKAVKSLEEDGHKILAVTNKGYMLDGSSDMLSEQGIRVNLAEKYAANEIIIMSVTDSTSTQAKKLVMDGAAHGTLVLADEQTAGRGRQGKSFFSPRGEGLYMSIILKPHPNMKELQMITIAAAVSVCQAIEKLTDKKPQIKWVNDLYLDGKKVCGILSEAVMDFESGGIESIVVGVGVDCAINEEAVPEELRGIVGSLETKNLSRNKLAAEIASGILDGFDRLAENSVIDEYRSRSMMLGKYISFQRNNEKLQGIVTGISDSGNLLVRLANGKDLVLNSGEVTIGSLKAD